LDATREKAGQGVDTSPILQQQQEKSGEEREEKRESGHEKKTKVKRQDTSQGKTRTKYYYKK
jgi:hypothetical protein